MPPRDTLDFTAALALGAVLGWTLVTTLRSDEGVPTERRRPRLSAVTRSKQGPEPILLKGLKDELGRVAREAGDQLAGAALRRLGRAIGGAERAGGR